MTELFLFGQSHWGSRLATVLNGRAHDVRARFVAPSSYPRALLDVRRAQSPVVMRIGFRPGATSRRGRLFDAYWAALRRVRPDLGACFFWVGSDVLYSLEDHRAGTSREDKLEAARPDLHVVEAPWLVEELATLGIAAEVVNPPNGYQPPLQAPAMPEQFQVLTYIPANRFEFYGGPTIMDVASRFPDVKFVIIGRDSEQLCPPSDNVVCLGWVSDMAAIYAQASVVLRIPQHDGLGGAVVEGLFNARHVIYNHEVPFCRVVVPATAEGVARHIAELHAAHQRGDLRSNEAGREYALTHLDEGRRADDLLDRIRLLASSSREA